MAGPRRSALWHIASCLCCTFLLSSSSIASGPANNAPAVPSNAQATTALLQGRVDEAAAILHALLAAQPADALAHQLLCRVFYAQDMGDTAIHECELAVTNAANSSDNHLWLGRAYGLKASHAGSLTAFGLAKKVRDEFEHAVQLDPMAPRAASDLGQFYINAPGIVGGGTDKAQALITRIEPQIPAYSHRLRAILAEKKKDSATAETEYKNAISAAKSNPIQSAAWTDLAAFYQRHNQPDQSVAAVQSALALNPKDAVLVDSASILTAIHRSPELAERLLNEYLASSARTDEAPAFKVHLQLGDLLKNRGDIAGAQAQYTAAIALASSFPPARKAAHSP